MSREREGYREMLMFLAQKMIANKHITESDGKIPIGSVAKYLCG